MRSHYHTLATGELSDLGPGTEKVIDRHPSTYTLGPPSAQQTARLRFLIFIYFHCFLISVKVITIYMWRILCQVSWYFPANYFQLLKKGEK